MAAAAKDSHTYFYEDEVFTVDKRGRVKFGVIVSPGTISDEEDEDYVDPGKVRVTWHPDGKEAVLPVHQVSTHYPTSHPQLTPSLPGRSGRPHIGPGGRGASVGRQWPAETVWLLPRDDRVRRHERSGH